MIRSAGGALKETCDPTTRISSNSHAQITLIYNKDMVKNFLSLIITQITSNTKQNGKQMDFKKTKTVLFFALI